MSYNGVNPHSIILMDNTSIYHCEDISDMFNQEFILWTLGVGALLLCFPSCSPDYNPIELFLKLKNTVKLYEKSSESNEMDTESIVYASLAYIIPEDC